MCGFQGHGKSYKEQCSFKIVFVVLNVIEKQWNTEGAHETTQFDVESLC